MPGQAIRKKSSDRKQSISLEFKDKHVLLVDDSIVRGTTCREIIKMARSEANRYRLHLPRHLYVTRVYGIDMPAAEELIAYETVDEIPTVIGADG